MKGLSVFATVTVALINTISGQPDRAGTLNSPVPVNEPVTHIVMFQFKNGTRDIAEDVCLLQFPILSLAWSKPSQIKVAKKKSHSWLLNS